MRAFPWFRSIAKTPVIIQMEATECGAASLAMILAYYGCYISLTELREACSISRDGSKASNIIKAAKSYGLEAYLYTLSVDDVKLLKPPFIAYWGFSHFLVVEGFHKGQVYLNDPADGERIVSEAEFSEYFTGIALCLIPTKEFKKRGQKISFIASLSRRLKGHAFILSFLLLTGFALILPSLLLPVFSKVFVDDYLVRHLETWFVPLIIGMVVTAIIQGLLTWLQNYYLLKFQLYLSLSTAKEFIAHALKLSFNFFGQRSAGDITQRYNMCDQIANTIATYFIATALSLFTVFFYLILMLFYSIPLTLIGSVVILTNIFIIYALSRKQININKNLSYEMGYLYGLSMNGINLIETYKASATENELFSRWAGYLTKVINLSQVANRLTQFSLSANDFLVSLNFILVLGLGGYLIMTTEMSVGTLVAFQSLLFGLMRPLTQLVGINSNLQRMEGNFNRVDEVLTYPLPDEKSAVDSGDDHSKLSGQLVVSDLVYSYSKDSPLVIDHINLSLEAGKTIGVVGPSRCGGTSLAQLIMGLYTPLSGQINFDGKPRQAITDACFVHSVAWVGQDVHLFEGSVKDNITLWKDTISEEDIIQAAKDACIHDAIVARSDAYNSFVREGANNFSGGEAQRIALARALATNPSLLILDSATSALDAPVQAEVYRNIRRRGCACLIIAHRLSAVRDCDEIVVMDNGCIVERGTHVQLIAAGGLYAKLTQQA